MNAYESTWPDPNAFTAREHLRLAELSGRPDVQQRVRRVAGLRPISPFVHELPVRIVVTSPVDTGEQVESRTYAGTGSSIPPHVDAWLSERYAGQPERRTYTGNHIDKTAPPKGYPAPGPRKNIRPHYERPWRRRLLNDLINRA